MIEGITKVFLVVETFTSFDPVQTEDHEPNVFESLKRKIYFTREAAQNAVDGYYRDRDALASWEYNDFSVVEVDLPFALEESLRHGLAFVVQQRGLELEHVVTIGSLHGYRVKQPEPQST